MVMSRAVACPCDRHEESVSLSTTEKAVGPLILMTATPAGIRPDARAAIVSLTAVDRLVSIDFDQCHFVDVVGISLRVSS